MGHVHMYEEAHYHTNTLQLTLYTSYSAISEKIMCGKLYVQNVVVYNTEFVWYFLVDISDKPITVLSTKYKITLQNNVIITLVWLIISHLTM